MKMMKTKIYESNTCYKKGGRKMKTPKNGCRAVNKGTGYAVECHGEVVSKREMTQEKATAMAERLNAKHTEKSEK